ncbi:arsenite efflux transporter metallochaperone ArsD [Rhabdothermincola sediminis]|uniref:arsenite efflux transporter metallochaperone ArsD n=1 Tax=Rhabdothermincola sediminis TaxID=2751370 RepID=UPI001AA09E1F|nr:arsenite efflux transporter metallochaperone ArsD [Rhabdothermincola sediminis]
MTVIEVFDPAMCCSTGVCGPSPDPVLATFTADLDWLAARGVEVRRFNLSQEPGAFVQRPAVQHLLTRDGEQALPIVVLDGEVRSSGRYPSRGELAGWAGVEAVEAVGVWSDAVAELVAVGAAVGANCEPCFKYHYDKARKFGVTNEELVAAVRTAQAVKDTPARAMLSLAARLLRVDAAAFGSPLAPASAPADEPTTETPDNGGSCCGSDEPVAIGATPGTGSAGASVTVPPAGDDGPGIPASGEPTGSGCCG